MAMWWKANVGIIFYGQQHPQICLIIWMSPSKKSKQGHLPEEISKTPVVHLQLITWGCFQFLKDPLQPPFRATPRCGKNQHILPGNPRRIQHPKNLGIWMYSLFMFFSYQKSEFHDIFMTSKSTSNLIHRVGFPCLCVWGLANFVPGTSSREDGGTYGNIMRGNPASKSIARWV